jgi:ABC-2 type transport system ATP-binding protein
VTATAVEVDGLTKAYGGRPVLEGVSFAVPAGSIVALLGPNGAGKTTTVEILEGYRHSDGGRVGVLGLDPRADGPALRRRVGVMLQAGGLYPLSNARELLRLFARYFADPLPPDALLERLGLEAVADARVRTLSGGERQRLALALALVGRPELLVLDEPTAGMDPAAKRATRELLDGLRGDGTTILLTTHELADVERLADRVVVLDRGHVAADTAPDSLTGGGAPAIRFRTGTPLDPTTLGAIGGWLGGTIVPEAGGWNRLDGLPPTPATIAALAHACAEHEVLVAELRVGGGTLEERYLELVGDHGTADDG